VPSGRRDEPIEGGLSCGIIDQLGTDEEPQSDIDRLAPEPRPAVLLGQIGDLTEHQVQSVAGHRLLQRQEDVLVFGQPTWALDQCHGRIGPACHLGARGPQSAGDHACGVHVPQAVPVGEVREGGHLEVGTVQLGGVHAAQFAADVELQQAERSAIVVGVGPGQHVGLQAFVAQQQAGQARRDPQRGAVGAQIAAEDPSW
jgi:hypothetical protein